MLGLVDTAPIPVGGSTQVYVDWDLRGEKGFHNVDVTADKLFAVDESDESNNTARRLIQVQGNKAK